MVAKLGGVLQSAKPVRGLLESALAAGDGSLARNVKASLNQLKRGPGRLCVRESWAGKAQRRCIAAVTAPCQIAAHRRSSNWIRVGDIL